MRRIATLLFLCSLSLAVIAAVSFGQTNNGANATRVAPPPISDAQRAALAAIQTKNEKSAAKVGLRMAGIVRRVYGNMLSEKPDENLRIRLAKELQETAAELLAIKGQSIREMVNVLTPEQRRYIRTELAKPGAPADLGELITRTYAITREETPAGRDPRYPAHWWTPVPQEGKSDWEILPQEAGPGEVILSKRNELGLLSNFAATPFAFRGKRYASLEGFWQMMLYPEGPSDTRAKFPGIEWKYTREQVAQMTSFEAKSAGTMAEENMKKMGIDWVTFEGRRFRYRSATPGVHYRLIVEATWAKVRQNSEVRKVLLSTGDLVLRPDHHSEEGAPPEWRYFEILTRIRTRLLRR